MKIRSLISNQLYFGLEPLSLRRGTERTLSRVFGLPPDRVRVTRETLREDFRLDMNETDALIRSLVAGGLLQADPENAGNYRLTERFHEFAQARVVAPLERREAKDLVDKACRLAAQINAERTWNPVMIDMLGVSGSYMSRSETIAELTLWPVVKTRAQIRPRRFGAPMTKAEGSSEIRAALRALSPFILVHLVTDTASVERPFSVPFRAYDELVASSLAPAKLLAWSSSIRRQLGGR
ncbi:MAG TPA: hypothetical protein VH704_10635 [Casimicrobiaceae bacterium]|jgi:hypothetical protein|nr:hypothetical protein [Casimicrobiaceae bacterium]